MNACFLVPLILKSAKGSIFLAIHFRNITENLNNKTKRHINVYFEFQGYVAISKKFKILKNSKNLKFKMP